MVKTVQKAIRIIDELSGNDNLGVTDLCDILGIPKSSAHNILETLVHERVLEKRRDSNKYSLGVRLVELGNRAQLNLDITRVSHPYLISLNETTGETVHLTVLDNDEVLYVDCVESKMRIRTYSVIGARAPLYCTAVGKAILAFLNSEDQDRILREKGTPRMTANTISDEKSLRADLRKVVQRRYSIDNMEHEDYLRCVGAPIRNWKGEVYASISISGPSQRLTYKRIAAIASPLITATEDISRNLGFRNRAG
ncbi:MAG TPA: IclR family transcriptional regulator [Spirochaetia bacterium]|nr:IclR family transcriptional regulator [Spirochaetia bacterium]